MNTRASQNSSGVNLFDLPNFEIVVYPAKVMIKDALPELCHWITVVIHLKERTIYLLDSLGKDGHLETRDSMEKIFFATHSSKVPLK